MTWDEFVTRHYKELAAHHGWELRFVRDVLMRVATLSPDVIQYQKTVIDSTGTKRRIDFAISEGDQVRIAIEVDGWDKTGAGRGMNRQELDDYLVRQNALSQQGWTVLRFLNSRFVRSPQECIREIERTLLLARKNAMRGLTPQAPLSLEHKRRRLSAVIMVIAVILGLVGAGGAWSVWTGRSAMESASSVPDTPSSADILARRPTSPPERSTQARDFASLDTVQSEEPLLENIGVSVGSREQSPPAQPRSPREETSVDRVTVGPVPRGDTASGDAVPSVSSSNSFILTSAASEHIGERRTVCGLVAQVTFAYQAPGRPTYLNFDRPYPDHSFSVLIPFSERQQLRRELRHDPEEIYENQILCVSGVIAENSDHLPQIRVRSTADIRREPMPPH